MCRAGIVTDTLVYCRLDTGSGSDRAAANLVSEESSQPENWRVATVRGGLPDCGGVAVVPYRPWSVVPVTGLASGCTTGVVSALLTTDVTPLSADAGTAAAAGVPEAVIDHGVWWTTVRPRACSSATTRAR